MEKDDDKETKNQLELTPVTPDDPSCLHSLPTVPRIEHASEERAATDVCVHSPEDGTNNLVTVCKDHKGEDVCSEYSTQNELELPPEVLFLVYQFLTSSQLRSCLLVCKSWNAVAVNILNSRTSQEKSKPKERYKRQEVPHSRWVIGIFVLVMMSCLLGITFFTTFWRITSESGSTTPLLISIFCGWIMTFIPMCIFYLVSLCLGFEHKRPSPVVIVFIITAMSWWTGFGMFISMQAAYYMEYESKLLVLEGATGDTVEAEWAKGALKHNYCAFVLTEELGVISDLRGYSEIIEQSHKNAWNIRMAIVAPIAKITSPHSVESHLNDHVFVVCQCSGIETVERQLPTTRTHIRRECERCAEKWSMEPPFCLLLDGLGCFDRGDWKSKIAVSQMALKNFTHGEETFANTAFVEWRNYSQYKSNWNEEGFNALKISTLRDISIFGTLLVAGTCITGLLSLKERRYIHKI